MRYMRYKAREVRQSNNCSLKKSGFPFIFEKLAGKKNFGHRKFRPRSITTLQVQLSNKQTYATNAFVENERQS